MSPADIKKLEDKISQLEKLVLAHIKQERQRDWLDNPTLVKKLDSIAETETSIPEKDASV